jgi:hypothetical protein
MYRRHMRRRLRMASLARATVSAMFRISTLRAHHGSCEETRPFKLFNFGI